MEVQCLTSAEADADIKRANPYFPKKKNSFFRFVIFKKF